jgi:hypothetical protein
MANGIAFLQVYRNPENASDCAILMLNNAVGKKINVLN